MIPRFLICDDLESDREFVLHTQEPRLLIEFTDDEGTIVEWFDDQSDFMSRAEHAGRDPAVELARVMRDAGDFYVEN